MEKNIKEILEKTKKKNKENKVLLQKLRQAKNSIGSIKAGNIDALVIGDKKELKVYTEKTADKLYRVLIEKMHEGAVTLNDDGIILYCNISFANMVRLPLQRVIGTAFISFIEDSSKDNFKALVKKALEHAVNEEIILNTGDKKMIPVLMSVNTFPLDEIIILSIIITDLTIQNKNQQELKFRAKELQNKNIELEKANRELAYQSKEKEKRAAELKLIYEGIKTQREELKVANIELYEKAVLLQQQDEKLVSINNDLLSLNQNLEKRVFERTAELQNLNKELNELSLSKDKFLSVISHDLRNPFSALLISTDLLNDKAEDDILKAIQPLVKIIYRTSHKIFQQLNDVINWAQTQRQKLTLKLEKINLVSGVDQSLELLNDIAIQKRVVIENNVPGDINVSADNIMLRSILQNLITNAIKYTPPNGLITINAQRINKMVEVNICDSGNGIKGEIRDNIFLQQGTVSIAGTNNEKGTGIGLLLVKDFVIQHGGTIRIESEAGNGSCIIFTLFEWLM